MTRFEEPLIDDYLIQKQFEPPRHAPAACNDNFERGNYCPRCDKATIAPTASEYHGDGLIHHRWLCAACGRDWMTATRLPSSR